MSRKKLCIVAGVDEFSASARMNQYETGKHVPYLLSLKQISKILKIPLAYFYAEEGMLGDLLICFEKMNKYARNSLLKHAQGKIA